MCYKPILSLYEKYVKSDEYLRISIFALFLAILQDRTNISLYLLSKRSEDGRAFSAHMEIDVVLVL